MDIATVSGLLMGVFCIVGAIVVDAGFGGLLAFANLPSVFVVIGGGVASTLVAFRLNEVTSVFKICSNTFSAKEDSKEDTIRMLVDLSNKARREGLLALEAEQAKISDDFVKQSLQLVVDGVEPGTIKESMELELSNLEGRHVIGQGLLKTMGSMFPTWGMLGTVIGLINMLGNLDDPSTIGPAMSIALVTTFYGSILANLVCNPMADKLSLKGRQEVQLKEMIIEGILSIQAGENPRIMEHKLKTFLSPDQKARYESMSGSITGNTSSETATA